MTGMLDSLKTINSLVRTLLAVVVVGAAGVTGWWGYTTYNAADIEAAKKTRELETAQQQLGQLKTDLDATQRDVETKARQIAQLHDDVKQREKEILKLNTALKLLKVDHRLARLTVVEQAQAPGSDETLSVVEFVELNDEGMPIDEPKVFRIQGDVVYVDNWVVKFEDKYVEQADIDRSTSLLLFRRIFGERQKPEDGFPLEKPGGPPGAYARGGVISEFEKKIWDDFWSIANDRDKAEALGIRAAHGDAAYIKMQPGRTYKLILRASDGVSIVPDQPTPPTRKQTTLRPSGRISSSRTS